MQNSENLKRIIEMPSSFTVGELATILEIPVTTLIAQLFKNGLIATINQRIDCDTAQIIVEELGLAIELKQKKEVSSTSKDSKIQKSEDKASNELRPPIVAIMGHVDHGKTTLLDTIIGLKVTDGESGGITQHIASYQKEYNNKLITFLDTPGHEAFSSLRQHGANLTDIVVLVVAADDGVKPQTQEALRFATESGAKIIVAITKIDKPEADLNRVKQSLSEINLMPEEWGGSTVIVPISAKTGEGIDSLLEMILLYADLEEFSADIKSHARGLVIESKMEKGFGPLIHVLITQGIINKGDFISVGSAFGKVKRLLSWSSKDLESAKPATPVQIVGLKNLPDFGQTLQVYKSEKEAKSAATSFNKMAGSSGSLNSEELLRIMSRRSGTAEMPIILKADVQGSLQSVSDAINLLQTDEVRAKIIGSGVGQITENDIMQASSVGATIYGFHSTIPATIQKLAQNQNVKIKDYKIIYELIDDIKMELSSLLEPEIVEVQMGRLLVRGIFKTTPTEIICGGEVTKGTIKTSNRARIYRNDDLLADCLITKIQESHQEVKEVHAGTMCGLSLKV
jgi:translation initiation factor IF-2